MKNTSVCLIVTDFDVIGSNIIFPNAVLRPQKFITNQDKVNSKYDMLLHKLKR